VNYNVRKQIIPILTLIQKFTQQSPSFIISALYLPLYSCHLDEPYKIYTVEGLNLAVCILLVFDLLSYQLR